jgi:uncharacterized protein (TIGR03437 family)
MRAYSEVSVGGIAATVLYAGVVSPGLYQFNVVVPTAASNGDNGITATYDGSSTQVSTIISLQR